MKNSFPDVRRPAGIHLRNHCMNIDSVVEASTISANTAIRSPERPAVSSSKYFCDRLGSTIRTAADSCPISGKVAQSSHRERFVLSRYYLSSSQKRFWQSIKCSFRPKSVTGRNPKCPNKSFCSATQALMHSTASFS